MSGDSGKPRGGSSDAFDELLTAATHEPALLIPGSALASGRFVVHALLGTGGMGAVYRATDTHRGLEVAIKVLSRVEPAGIYSLKREFRTLAPVHHPNLVALHELFMDRGRWFFSMDLVAGRPLSEVDWSSSSLRDVFAQIAGAVHAIHQHGKLHRDLKPSNVMLEPSGRVVVLDFGLASDQEPGGAGWTLIDDGISGTPAYMAPEQATGRPRTQSDWYAFGTMLYEALFGRPPFAEPGIAALLRKREVPARRPARDGRVPQDLSDLCLRLLDRDAEKRPQYPEIAAVLGAATGPGLPSEAPVRAPFVGREAELEALEGALLETDRGRGVVVTISGGPGIGKTRLVERFLKRAEEDLDAVVLSGRCAGWEHVPFRTCDSVVDALSHYLRKLPAERVAAVLPRTTHALTQVFPVLGRLTATRTMKQRRALPREPKEIRRLGLAGLRDLLGNIAAQDRLVVFVDDLQWSDLDGARLLASLVLPTALGEGPAVLLIVAHRAVDPGEAAGLADFLDRVASHPDACVRRLQLAELSPRESHELAARLLDGAPHGIDAPLAREASGNPLVLGQNVRHVLESGSDAAPADLSEVLARRIARLAASERQCLRAVCLSERPVPLEMLAQVTGQSDPARAVRALVAAELARFSAGDPSTATAFHDRIREAVVAGMDADERQRLHSEFAAALQQTVDPDLADLAAHLLGCGRVQESAVCAVNAARSAASALAFERAASLYCLALDLGQWDARSRIELLVELGETLSLDRRSGQAGDRLLEAAAAETDALRSRALRLRAADEYLAAGWLEVGIGVLRQVFVEVGLDYDAIRTSNLVELRQRISHRGLGFSPRTEGDIEPETRARLDALAVAGRGLAWLKPESIQFRLVLALEALDAGEPMRIATGLRTVARLDAQFSSDDDEVYGVVRRICEEHPGLEADEMAPALESGVAVARGRPWDLYEAVRRTEELLLQKPAPEARELDVARFHQAVAIYLQGEVVDLHHACWGWLQDSEERRDVFLGSWLNALLAHQCLARNRPDAARGMCSEARRSWAAVEDMDAPMLYLACVDARHACDAYDGDGSAFDRLQVAGEWFDRSTLRHLPFLACHWHSMRATAALACAVQEGPGRSRRAELLREVEYSTAIVDAPLSAEGRQLALPHYRNLATLLRAGLAAARGDVASALRGLDRGIEQLSLAGHYSLRLAHARRAKGLLLGGNEGNAWTTRAEAELLGLGVVQPGRHAMAVLPGFMS